MAKLAEYDRCACGGLKRKASARCRRCYYRRLKAAAQAHKLALAASQGEGVVVVVEKRSDLVQLARALRACEAAGLARA
jgi:hypothetical protein